MQRNMDLVRTILLKVEKNPSGTASKDLGIHSFSEQEIGYHAHIMKQEGLIEADDSPSTTHQGPSPILRSLTWKGHEFLDLARDQLRWNRAKATIEKIGGAPISVWSKLLSDLMLQSVEATVAKAS